MPGQQVQLGMAGDRVDQLRRVSALAEQLERDPGVAALEGGVLLVVEIVEDPGRGPEILVFLEPGRVGAHRRFHPEYVAPQRLRLGPFAEQVPGFISAR